MEFKIFKKAQYIIHLIGDMKLTVNDFNKVLQLHKLNCKSISEVITEFKGLLVSNVTNTFKNSLIEEKRKDVFVSYNNVLTMLIGLLEQEEEYELCAELLKIKNEIIENFNDCEERHNDIKELMELVK